MAEMAMADLPPEPNGHAADGPLALADVPAPSSAAGPPPPPATFSLRRNIKQLPPITATLCVALGGSLGALLRYGFIQACAHYQASSTTSTAADGSTVVTLHKPFPLSTFISNMLGCLLIGLLSTLLPALLPAPPHLLHCRSLLVTGFLGALTTMSSFALDTAQLLQHQRSRRQDEAGVVVQSSGGREWMGVVYWVVTNVGGVGLVVIGRRIARWAVRRHASGGKREADVVGPLDGQVQGIDATRAVVRDAAAATLKEQAMVEEGASVDAESAKH